MSRRYALTARARADLASIAAHIGEVAGPLTAERVVLAFRSAFSVLGRQPNAGHARDDLTDDASVRFWPVHSWLIAYSGQARPVTVLAIVHGARQPDELFRLIAELSRERPGFPRD